MASAISPGSMRPGITPLSRAISVASTSAGIDSPTPTMSGVITVPGQTQLTRTPAPAVVWRAPTVAASVASSAAVAAPIPDAAPVTSATLPSNLMTSSIDFTDSACPHYGDRSRGGPAVPEGSQVDLFGPARLGP